MLGTCRLNNKTMRNIRRDQTYQCLVIDLAMLGVLSQEEAELLIGSGIPKNLLLPDGTPGKLIKEAEINKLTEDSIVKTEEPEPEPEPEPEETESEE